MVVIVLIGLIAGLILPAIAKSRQKATAFQCVDNGRTIGAAFQKYASDHDGAVLPARRTQLGKKKVENWTELLDGYMKNHNEWHCPGCRSGKHGQFGVGYNHRVSQLKTLSAIANPKATVAFGDTAEIENPEEPNPDRWREKPRDPKNTSHQPALLFETPANAEWKTTPNRLVNRHLGRAAVIFVDGHVDLRPVRAVGFQYQAGHPRALWDEQ